MTKRLYTETFTLLLLLQTIPEARAAMDTVIEEQETAKRLADSFANDCNSLYDGVPEISTPGTKARTIRDFLPKMRERRR